MRRPGGKFDRRVRRALRAGDILARLPGGEYQLVRGNLDLDAAHVRILLSRPFLGGRLRPSGDHLPGFAGCSQTWFWQACPRPRPAFLDAIARSAVAHSPGATP